MDFSLLNLLLHTFGAHLFFTGNYEIQYIILQEKQQVVNFRQI